MTRDALIVVLATIGAMNSGVLALLLRDRRRDKARAKAMVETLRTFSGAPVPLDDMLARFLADCTIAQPCARVQSSALYEAFDGWCRQNGERCWSQKGFSRAMSDAGYEKVVREGVRWVGVRLNDMPDDPGARPVTLNSLNPQSRRRVL